MAFNYFSKNGNILPIEQATVPLSNIEYAYGFGVYETIRAYNGKAHFLNEHINRLLESAKIIKLDHDFSYSFIEQSVLDLVKNSNSKAYNLKMLLIGGPTKEEAQIFIMCFNPLFTDKKLYKEGAAFITSNYERVYPHAKSLNMLQSYMAYKKARSVGAHDSLLINNKGYITEGTRTNFFGIKDKTIFTPKEEDILLGVTRKAIIRAAIKNGFEIVQKNIILADLKSFDGAFITSTSVKIIPIRLIDGIVIYEKPSENLKELMKAFDNYLTECDGVLI
mgnify:CR=1 FL=1